MWAIIVTNQSTPVQLTLVATREDLEAQVQAAKERWSLVHPKTVNILQGPRHTSGPSLKTVAITVDDLKKPAYTLTVVPRVTVASSLKVPRLWRYCPECGDSWLSHLSGQADLPIEDWEPCPCELCGCRKALTHE